MLGTPLLKSNEPTTSLSSRSLATPTQTPKKTRFNLFNSSNPQIQKPLFSIKLIKFAEQQLPNLTAVSNLIDQIEKQAIVEAERKVSTEKFTFDILPIILISLEKLRNKVLELKSSTGTDLNMLNSVDHKIISTQINLFKLIKNKGDFISLLNKKDFFSELHKNILHFIDSPANINCYSYSCETGQRTKIASPPLFMEHTKSPKSDQDVVEKCLEILAGEETTNPNKEKIKKVREILNYWLEQLTSGHLIQLPNYYHATSYLPGIILTGNIFVMHRGMFPGAWTSVGYPETDRRGEGYGSYYIPLSRRIEHQTSTSHYSTNGWVSNGKTYGWAVFKSDIPVFYKGNQKIFIGHHYSDSPEKALQTQQEFVQNVNWMYDRQDHTTKICGFKIGKKDLRKIKLQGRTYFISESELKRRIESIEIIPENTFLYLVDLLNKARFPMVYPTMQPAPRD